MATATVTVKITPYELQLIDEALNLLFKTSISIARKEPPQPTVNFDLSDGDPRALAHRAGELRRNLGMK